jgi:hypothetical protein
MSGDLVVEKSGISFDPPLVPLLTFDGPIGRTGVCRLWCWVESLMASRTGSRRALCIGQGMKGVLGFACPPGQDSR